MSFILTLSLFLSIYFLCLFLIFNFRSLPVSHSVDNGSNLYLFICHKKKVNVDTNWESFFLFFSFFLYERILLRIIKDRFKSSLQQKITTKGHYKVKHYITTSLNVFPPSPITQITTSRFFWNYFFQFMPRFCLFSFSWWSLLQMKSKKHYTQGKAIKMLIFSLYGDTNQMAVYLVITVFRDDLTKLPKIKMKSPPIFSVRVWSVTRDTCL